MDKYNFLKLLRKYLDGKASPEEKSFIVSYYNLFEQEPDVLALLDDEKKAFLKEDIKASMWAQIAKDEQIPRTRTIRKLWVPILSAAAVLMVLFSFLFLIRPSFFRKNTDAMSMLINNRPVEYPVQLPDGSKVILGAGSILHYSSSFASDEQRKVYLEGNAFFDVVHHTSRPFTVYSGKIHTTVLGTAFSVEAASWYKDIVITVSRGKVKVADSAHTQGIIMPNEQIVYNKLKSVSSLRNVDASNYNSWKGINLIFDDVSVAEAAAVISKKFKVKILFADDLIQSKKFTATLSNKETIEFMLNSICEFNNAVYSYDKEKAIVIIKAKSNSRTL